MINKLFLTLATPILSHPPCQRSLTHSVSSQHILVSHLLTPHSPHPHTSHNFTHTLLSLCRYDNYGVTDDQQSAYLLNICSHLLALTTPLPHSHTHTHPLSVDMTITASPMINNQLTLSTHFPTYSPTKPHPLTHSHRLHALLSVDMTTTVSPTINK